jgi:hypothetical protein
MPTDALGDARKKPGKHSTKKAKLKRVLPKRRNTAGATSLKMRLDLWQNWTTA